MTRLLALGYVLSAAAAALAWALTRRRAEHRPVAALLSYAFALDIGRRAWRTWVLLPGYAALQGAPATGGLRVAANVEQALFISWPAAIAAASTVVFLRRRPWIVAIVWAVAALAITLNYPALRGASLQRAYLACQLAGIVTGLGCMLTWAMPFKEKPELHHVSIGLVTVIEGGSLLVGPWRLSVFDNWPLEQVIYCALYAVLIALQGGALWNSPSVSQSD